MQPRPAVSTQDQLRTRVLQQMLSKQELSAHNHKALDAKNTINQELNQASPTDWTPADKADAQAQLATEWSDITARLAKLSAEHQRRQAEMATVRAMIGKLEATVPIARQREQDFAALTAQGFMSGHANQDRTSERIELRTRPGHPAGPIPGSPGRPARSRANPQPPTWQKHAQP